MEEERLGYQDEEISLIVERYEQMKKENKTLFFDVSEFETIIDYYLDQNDVNYAYEAAETAFIQHPGSVTLQLKKAKVLIDKGRAVESLRAIKLVESIEPGNSEIYIIKGAAMGMLGDVQGTRRCFDTALSIDPDEEISILLSISSILFNLNHYKTLVPYLQRLIALEPEFDNHIYDLAFAYDKMEDFEQAIEYYNMYLDREPYSDNAWYNLAILYNKTNRMNDALEAYEFSLAINPENSFAIFNKGNILFNMGEYKSALRAYLEYVNVEEESPEALSYIAECYFKIGEKARAVEYFREAIEFDPEYPDAWFGLGLISYEGKEYNESLHYFSRSYKLDSDNPEYIYYLGLAQRNLDNTISSIRSFMRALKLDPFYDLAWKELARSIIEADLCLKAIPVLKKSLKVTGDVHGLRFVLALLMIYTGNKDESEYHLMKAVDLCDGDTSVFEDMFPGGLSVAKS